MKQAGIMASTVALALTSLLHSTVPNLGLSSSVISGQLTCYNERPYTQPPEIIFIGQFVWE